MAGTMSTCDLQKRLTPTSAADGWLLAPVLRSNATLAFAAERQVFRRTRREPLQGTAPPNIRSAMMVLQARAVAAERLDDLQCVVVVFAENSNGSGERLELQRALAFDEQDRSLGMDKYCICLTGGQTAYGGIRSVHLTANLLSLEFAHATADLLGIDDMVRIEFEAEAPVFERIQRELAFIFSVERGRPALVGLGEAAG